MRRSFAIIAAALLWTSAAPHGLAAAEIKVLSPGAMMSSLKALVPQFEEASGHQVTVVYAPALAIPDRVKDGEGVDLVIVGEASAASLEKLGKLKAGSKTVIGRVGVGVFVRRGDPKPEIGTVEAFERALINAKVITYSDPALGGSASNYVNDLLKSLDVTGSVQSKVKLATKYRSLADSVVAGGVDFGLNQIAEIVADQRLELVGPLPAPLQRYTNYTAGIVTGSASQQAAQDLIAFLGSPAAVDVMKVRGFEPL
jgi:molybdate transport system substrate-binding protein